MTGVQTCALPICQLGEDECESLEAHFQQCQQCTAAAETLTGYDTMLEAARECKPLNTTEREAVARLVVRLENAPNGNGVNDTDDSVAEHVSEEESQPEKEHRGNRCLTTPAT